MSEIQLKEYIHSVGKAANQRLRELEKQGLESSSAAYRYIERLATDSDLATARTNAGQIKFNLRVRGRNIQELRHMAATIQRFTEGRTSTVTGVKGALKQAWQTFEQSQPGANMTFGEFAEAMANTLFKNFAKIYGSKTAGAVMDYARGLGLSTAEITGALRAAGFSPDGGTAPDLVKIYDSLDNFAEHKKTVGDGADGLFTDNSI